MKHLLILFLFFVSSIQLWSQTIDLALDKKDAKCGYINHLGEVVIPFQFDVTEGFQGDIP